MSIYPRALAAVLSWRLCFEAVGRSTGLRQAQGTVSRGPWILRVRRIG